MSEQRDARVLVVSDVGSDAELLHQLLSDSFTAVALSVKADEFARDFERHRPQVLVIAMKTVADAERCYLGLYRKCALINSLPHRTLLLCSKDEVARAYQLCCENYFDDYVLFWPMTHDGPRLRMSVRLALRMLDSAQAGAPLTQLAAQARLIADLNVQLTQAAAAAQSTAAQALSAGVVGGAAVTVQAPIPQAAPAAQAGPGPLPKPRPYLWVVDDDEFMRKLLTRILGAANYDVAAFASGAAAIDASAERLPQLILMDVMMPDINGIELTRQLRSLKSYVNIPIVMLTGQSEKKTIVGSKTAGATDFIVKPVDREILLAKVARYLNT